MKTKILIFGALIVLLNIGCGKQQPKSFSPTPPQYLQKGEDLPQQPNLEQENRLSNDEITKIGKKIIKTADLSIETKDYQKTISEIKNTLKKFDCYIQQENENNYENNIVTTIVIKVKNTQFDSLVNQILASPQTNINSKNIYISDVTEQYIDYYIRVKNKKLTEEQYQQILKKAKTVSEILEVQKYLNEVRTEIETFEGKLKYIDYQVKYSTINLTINYSKPSNFSSFGELIVEALKGGWIGIKYVTLGIIALWPVWLILGIIFYFRKKRKKQKISQ